MVNFIWNIVCSWEPAVYSAIAACFSVAASVMVYLFNRRQYKKKFKSDLYNTVTQLAGFVNYIRFLYRYHKIYTTSQVEEIIGQIQNINKNLLNSTESFYFNDQFDLKTIIKINSFFERYIGWRAFKIIDLTEIFLETGNLCNLQKKALEALTVIRDEYGKSDKKIKKILDSSLRNMEEISRTCDEDEKKLRYIGSNLCYIFSISEIQNNLKNFGNEEVIKWEEVKKCIIVKCYKIFLSGDMKDKNYNEAIQFLFDCQIIDWGYKDEKKDDEKDDGKKSIIFSTIDNKNMEWEIIKPFFQSIIGKLMLDRMDSNH
ncbi:hypothetical protein AB840_04090 [Megasphaera cerevisiae DSM 20462]|uniref:Uncharacterized protein n=1 Tax=Megasphaera cerevisiae DSM 20462 TaxID=1122219 RepID=A0A0J6WUK2_9FIRM|nr:hypothetical protein [Megasphaera cerevisiae]KMO87215.1 hypothetical protein AB840_04090 [Megasphaera cerevisiae DSM 20462]SJZ60807.1 hypothetical protein SAMN05660900_00949 [Megasphaera cerevisiae DSM 20462]